jgi:hypothetical protein
MSKLSIKVGYTYNGLSKYTNNGANNTVTMAAKLEYLVNLTTLTQVKISKAPSVKPIGNKVPKAVATALPPLKLKNIGYI